MKFITLGTLQFPAVGLGTYKITGPIAVEIFKKAIRIGYRFFDTAQLYENECELGKAIIESGLPRSDFFLTTKVWPSNFSKDRFIPSVEASLRKLNTDRVDLLLIHWPHNKFQVEEYIPMLMQSQQLGLATEIGVSNFNITQLKAALKVGARIVTNQVEFNPWINQTKLHNWMREHKIPLTAYCPLSQGQMMNDKKLEALAAHYLRTPAQIILRWMMQKEDVLAIPKSTNVYRLEENINIFDFDLSESDIEIIDAWRLENIRVVGLQQGAKWD